MTNPITVLDAANYILKREANAFPSKSGYLRCRDCIGDNGWDDAADFVEDTNPKMEAN